MKKNKTVLIIRRKIKNLKKKHNGESVTLPVARRTNNRKVVGSRPAEVVCITVLTGNRLG